MQKALYRAIVWCLILSVIILSCVRASAEEAQTASAPESRNIINGKENLKAENIEEAIEDFKLAREEAPGSAVAAYFLGIAYKKALAYDDALKNLSDAVTLVPAVSEAVLELAEVHYQLGDYDKAMENLRLAEGLGVKPAETAFIKGLIFLKQGRNREARGSFRRAKSLDATLTQNADYQIAMASLRDGNLDEAKEIFREIIVRDPNADIAQFAKQYMDVVASKLKADRLLKITVDLQYQYDDNVLLYSFYNISHRNLASHDVMSHTFSLVPGYNSEIGSFSAIMSYNYTMVDDFKYIQTYSVTPTYQFSTGRGHFASVFVKAQKKEYIRPAFIPEEDRDSDEWGAGASWYYLLAENSGFFNISYAFNHEDTQGTNWQYNGHKLGAGLSYPVTASVRFNLGGEAYLQDFEDKNTVFNKVRKDKTYTGSSTLSYAVTDDIDAQLQYNFVRGDSNVTVYDYQKNVYSAGIEARF
ncbi:MAG: tetratricopeptide repeat protein [Deltaproteobacteria bacterium]|nr:tetratricopeptide repeat protein [Deltaproteobacteria bacterium]